MNILLILFALPIATILLAIVLQKVLRCPVLVAITFFAIYLVVAFAFFSASFLILVIIYTVLAYITAVIVECFIRRGCEICGERKNCCTSQNNTVSLSNADVARIASQILSQTNTNNGCNCQCGNNQEATPTVARVNIRDNNCNQSSWCCYRR